MNDESSAVEAKVKVSGPTGVDIALFHQVKTEGIGHSELLVAEALEDRGCGRDILRRGGQDLHRLEVFNEGKKLQRSVLVESAKEPGLPFGDDEGRGDKLRRIGKVA